MPGHLRRRTYRLSRVRGMKKLLLLVVLIALGAVAAKRLRAE